MKEIDIAIITRRSIHGVFALVSRTFIVRVVSLLSSFLLTVFLSPSVFGIFYVVSAAIAFLAYFSDIGLAAALIQKKEPITDEELKTTFTIQQVLVVSIVILALLASKTIGSFYNLEKEGVLLFQALAIAFFLSSLKTIPSILLERNLRFEKLVIPEIVESLAFYGTILFFAVQDYGITSFTYGVLARGLSGVLAIYIISPWKIRLGFSKIVAQRLLSFGIPFQANSILALIKDDALTVYLGKILPLDQVGYIGFAQKIAFTPLRLIMDNIIRITFPSFARLQNERKLLAIGIEKSIFSVAFFIFPSFFGLVLLFPYLIHLIPKYEKWEGALISISFFAANAIFSSISTPLTNALNAIGKIKITLYFMIFWTVTTWVLTPLSIMFFGFNGVAYTSAVISMSAIIVIYVAKRYIEFDVIKTVRYPLLASTIMGICLYFMRSIITTNILNFVLVLIFGVIVYIGTMLVFAKSQIIQDLKLIKKNISN